jgi:hypothetical protein
MMLALASGTAAAGWASLGDAGNAELFVDRSTIARDGDRVTMWSVYALKAPASANGVAYVSLKRQDEFDCKEPRIRGVQISAHPQPLGEGAPVASEKRATSWGPVTPQTTSEVLWKIACGKE